MQAWSPFYWADYVADTAHLSLAEHGAYVMLMAHYYNTGCAIPANASVLHRVCRCMNDADRDAVDVVLRNYFHLDGDVYRHNRIERELAKSQQISQVRRNAANKRHHAKASAIAVHEQVHLDTQSQPQSHSKTLPPPPEVRKPPEGLHPMQYAAHICDELVIPKKGNMETIASTIETLAKSRNTSPCEAHDYLLAKALTAKEAGETVNLFWFRDGKYNITKAVTRDNYKTTAELRNQRSDDSLERAFREVGTPENLPADVQQGADKRRGQGVGQGS